MSFVSFHYGTDEVDNAVLVFIKWSFLKSLKMLYKEKAHTWKLQCRTETDRVLKIWIVLANRPVMSTGWRKDHSFWMIFHRVVLIIRNKLNILCVIFQRLNSLIIFCYLASLGVLGTSTMLNFTVHLWKMWWILRVFRTLKKQHFANRWSL